MRSTGLTTDLRQLGESDHCCWAFKDEDEFSSRAISFLRIGIERGLQGVYVSDNPTEIAEAHLRRDEAASRLLDQGALSVWSVADTYANGTPEPDDQVDFYARATAKSLSVGYSGLRIAADATALITTPERAAAFARYEHLVDRFMTTSPFSAMCGYRSDSEANEEAVTQIAALHPVAIGAAPPLRLYAMEEGAFGLEGEIDFWSAGLLESTLRRADPAEQQKQVVLDLSGIEFMDHHGVKALVDYADSRGAQFLMTKPPSHVSRLIDILGVRNLTVAVS